MTTIDEKINLFASVVFDKAGKQAEEKMKQVKRHIEEQYSAEEKRIRDLARQMVEERAKKADAGSIQIVSKARMEARQNLLRKKEEMLDQIMIGLKKRAVQFVRTQGYEDFLRRAIRQVLDGLQGDQQLLLYFTTEDLIRHEDLIRSTIVANLQPNAVYTLHEAAGDIMGGCVCCNGRQTRKVDFTMASLLADNRELIGRIVMDDCSRWCQNGRQQ